MPPSLNGGFVLRTMFCVALFSFLILLGTYDYLVFQWLGSAWQHVAPYLPAAFNQPVDPAITKRLVPLVIIYALLYVSLCIVLLASLLGTWQRLRFVLLTYAIGFVLCMIMLLLGKATHNALGLYHLGRNIIDFMVSPLPVAMLAPLLLWYYPNEAAAPPLQPADRRTVL